MRWLGLVAMLVACGNDAAPASAPSPAEPLPTRVRVLTDAQYANAVRDLLDVTAPAVHVPGTTQHQFVHEDQIAVDAALLSQYRVAAQAIGRELAARSGVPGCAASDDACLRDVIATLVARAFRRPIVMGELDQLWQIFVLGRDGRHDARGDAAGLALVVEATLQAPDFVYRQELGELGELGSAVAGTVEVTPHELASELAFLLLDSIPDPALWTAAQDGTLSDPRVLAAQVDRLLATPRVQAHLDDVVLDWLEVHRVLDTGKDAVLFPELDPPLRDSMFGETARFVHDVLWQRGGSLRELLTSRATFVDGRLAKHYGVVATGGAAFVPITQDPAKRAGILTQASILTSLATEQRASIIQRGVYIHRHLLCTPELGRPPFAAIVEVSNVTYELSESQFSHYRMAHGYCSGCHKTIDPPGRALSAYDGLGRWQAVDEIGVPVESFTRVTIDGVAHELDDAIGLASALADSDHVARCVVDQLAHHALGRALADAATRDYLHARFEDSDRDLVEVFRAIATSPAFRRRATPGGRR